MIQSWRMAAVLDYITKPHTFLATAFRYSILDKASSGTGFFLLTLRHAGLGAANHVNAHRGAALQLSISTHHR